MQKITYRPLATISFPELHVRCNKSGVIVGDGSDPKSVQEASKLLTKLVLVTADSDGKSDLDIGLQREFSNDGLLLSIGVNTNFYDINEKQLSLWRKEISKLFTVCLSGLEDLEKYSDGDDLINIRYSEGEENSYNEEYKTLFISDVRAVEIIKCMANVNQTILKDHKVTKIEVYFCDDIYSLPVKLPEKISVLVCDRSKEHEAAGYIKQIDIDKRIFQIQRDGTVSLSDRITLEYEGDFDSTQQVEQDIFAAMNRGGIVHVAGYPYIKKDVTGHQIQKKFKLVNLDINYDVSI